MSVTGWMRLHDFETMNDEGDAGLQKYMSRAHLSPIKFNDVGLIAVNDLVPNGR